MTTTKRDDAARLESLVWHWRFFWFHPEPATTLGVVRIAFGVLMVAWTFALLPDLTSLFGDQSVMPEPLTAGHEWSLLEVANGRSAVLALWTVLLAASISMTIGWHSRLAALVVFVSVMSFQRGGSFVFNSGDALIRLEALFLVLAPSGAALSLDRQRTAGSFWSAQVRAPWVVRLMQVQLTVIYIFSVLNKLSGETWREGTAVSYALRMTDIGNFSPPDWFTSNALLMNAATWGTLIAEIAIGMLVWNRRARPWVLAIGVVVHAMIMAAFAIAFFSFAMYVLYLAFVPSDTMGRFVDSLRHRVRSTGPTAGEVAA